MPNLIEPVFSTTPARLLWTGLAALLPLAACAHATPAPAPIGRIACFDASPAEGYEWPFFLYVPEGIRSASEAPLLVMPNNTGEADDRLGVHRAAALKQLFSWRSYAQSLGAVTLVPAFPRPRARGELYTHALDRDSLAEGKGALHRLDLQLVEMVRAARVFLGSTPADGRFLLFGFSAAGMFANRFTLLHPDLVLASAVGSPGGWPMLPLRDWQGAALRYPLGSGDLEALTGRALDLEGLRQVPMFFFLGDQDTNDSLVFRDGYELGDEELVMRLFGKTPVERWPLAQATYARAGLPAVFKLYPGVGHDVTDAMDADVLDFFREVLRSSR